MLWMKGCGQENVLYMYVKSYLFLGICIFWSVAEERSTILYYDAGKVVEWKNSLLNLTFGINTYCILHFCWHKYLLNWYLSF